MVGSLACTQVRCMTKSLLLQHPFGKSVSKMGAVGILLFAGVASAAGPTCHKTAVCLMKKQEAKADPAVEARKAGGAKAPCSHKTAVCERTRMEPEARVAGAKASKATVPFCSHKTAVCSMQRQAASKKS
jgi:hypothetical protein